MKSYLEETITKFEESVNLEVSPKTKALIEYAKEILGDPMFIQQKGVQSIVDQDA